MRKMVHMKFPVPWLLFIITIAELTFDHSMEGSVVLWCGYGLYKFCDFN